MVRRWLIGGVGARHVTRGNHADACAGAKITLVRQEIVARPHVCHPRAWPEDPLRAYPRRLKLSGAVPCAPTGFTFSQAGPTARADSATLHKHRTKSENLRGSTRFGKHCSDGNGARPVQSRRPTPYARPHPTANLNNSPGARRRRGCKGRGGTGRRHLPSPMPSGRPS